MADDIAMPSLKHQMTNTCSVASADANVAITANNNTNRYVHPALSGSPLSTPAACSVRVSNPNALMSTSGTVYVGQSRDIIDLRNAGAINWTEYANALVSRSPNQAFSAAQLATKFVDAICAPCDIEELATFREYHPSVDANFTLNSNSGYYFYGFAPVWVYNPTGISLTYEVTIEYRVRPDVLSAFHNAVEFHKPASENTWLEAIKTVLAHGVIIAEAAAPVISMFM